MRIRKTVLAIAAVSAGVLGIPAAATATSSHGGPNAVGLTTAGTGLVRFDTDRPGKAAKARTVSGLVGDTKLVGIDRRVQNDRLYGVGNAGGLYTIAVRTSKAVKVGQLSVPLSGTSFGVDFNPAANALRVVSDTGQNLRQPFGTTDGPTVPTVADTALNYLGVPATGVTGAAYTNNDLDPLTATSLFDIDSALDQVVLQSPANSGGLAATGKLGVDAGSDVGFDIYSDLKKGKTASNKAFAVLSVGGRTGLYSVNLLTGDVTSKGSFARGISDIAVTLDR